MFTKTLLYITNLPWHLLSSSWTKFELLPAPSIHDHNKLLPCFINIVLVRRWRCDVLICMQTIRWRFKQLLYFLKSSIESALVLAKIINTEVFRKPLNKNKFMRISKMILFLFNWIDKTEEYTEIFQRTKIRHTLIK